MEKFYFTYASDDPKMPYKGGWAMIQAPNIKMATRIFEAVHPNNDDSEILNCADYYTEEGFKRTRMPIEGNFGKFCVETITVTCFQLEVPNGQA